MKTKKILLSFLLSIFVFSVSAPLLTACDIVNTNPPASSSDPFEKDPYENVIMEEWEKYFVVQNNAIVGMTSVIDKNCTELVIPSFIDGEPVYTIQQGVVENFPLLEKIIIGEGILSVEGLLWGNCPKLHELVIPASITRIFDNAYVHFYGAFSYIYVHKDNPVYKSIDGNVYTKDGKTLLLYAYKKTKETFNIPDGVTKIADGVAMMGDNLVNVSIPESVESIGGGAFLSEAIKYTVKDGLRYLGNKKNPYYYFIGLDSEDITIVNIHKDCKIIGSNAFSGGENVTKINIPEGLKSIHQDALWYSAMPNLQCNQDGNLLYLGNEENPYLYLHHCDFSTSTVANIHPDCRFIGTRFGGIEISGSITSVTFPDGISEIPSFAFADCQNLTEVNLGEGIKSIGDYAFQDCWSLESIQIPASVTNIGEGVFNCEYPPIGMDDSRMKTSLINIEVDEKNQHYKSIDGNLYTKDGKTLLQYALGKTETSFVIPDGVTKLGVAAFYKSMYLESIEIPASVMEIGVNALSGKKITSVSYKGGLKDWCKVDLARENENPFSIVGEGFSIENTSIDELTIPEGITTIKAYAFANSNITSVTIPDSVTRIEDGAFLGCNKLTAVIGGKNITRIGERAFSGCAELTSIDLPNGLVVIEANSFSGCESLTKLVLPVGIRVIEMEAFSGCTQLASVNIPSNVKRIENAAFLNCANLTSVSIPNGVNRIEESTFSGCANLVNVTLPDTINFIGKYAFKSCSALQYTDVDGLKYIGNESNPYAVLLGYTPPTDRTTFTLHDNCKYVWGLGFMATDVTEFIVGEANTAYKTIDGNLYSKDGRTLVKYAGGKEDTLFIIPDSVTEIISKAIPLSSGPKQILVPASVEIFPYDDFENKHFFFESKNTGFIYAILSIQNKVYIYSETKPTNFKKNLYWKYDENGGIHIWKTSDEG